MSIQKSQAKKVFVYAGATLLAVGGIHQLITTGLTASILTQILAIGLPLIVWGVILGIPGFFLFNHLHHYATLEPDPERYSAQAIATFRIQRQEWQDGFIAWIIANLISLVIAFIIGSASQMPILGVGFFALMFIATTKSDRLVAYPTIEELKIRTRNAGDHGDASWATVDEVSQLKAFPNHWDEFGKGIFLGNRTNPYITLFDPHNKFESEAFDKAHFSYTGETNGITFAPSGGGKNATAIIPTLLTNDESTFVLDVKVENFFVTSPARTDKGHEVILINPFNLFGKQIGNYDSFTHRFNPLANLDPNDPDFASNIRQIAAAMIIPDKGTDHFVNRAQNLVTCLIAHIPWLQS
jgi:type IV secretory pathway TraG/TraD family ATPase VirD4